jgi:S-formylglutathione hydrolase FrmB
VATVVTTPLGTALSVAAPSSETSHIVSEKPDGDQKTILTVYSAAMRESFPVHVLLPPRQDTPSPVYYLLLGVDGGKDGSTWDTATSYRSFFKTKNTYVVTPIGGAYSYYTDWQHRDPRLGKPMWQTFLTEELPPLIDERFNTTGRNAIGGISMAGTSVFNLAIAKPKLYKAVAAFSGCARTSDPVGVLSVMQVVDRGHGNVENMWGPVGGPGWIANDPYVQVPRMRGVMIYMTTGTGQPDVRDYLAAPDARALYLGYQLSTGSVIEAGVYNCTLQMAQRLRELQMPYKLTVRRVGTHTWKYWQGDLFSTWPGVARDLATG